jgi:hypothetical protein
MLPRRPTRLALAALIALAVGLAVLLDREGRGGGAGGPADPAPTPGAAIADHLPTPSAAVRAAGWQASAPRPGLDDPRAREPVELGLRQRHAGPADRVAARVEVTDPAGVVAAAAVVLEGDAWTFLTYPDAFAGAGPARAGAYRVRHLVESAVVAEDAFDVGG